MSLVSRFHKMGSSPARIDLALFRQDSGLGVVWLCSARIAMAAVMIFAIADRRMPWNLTH
jgi:hypothetical protein